MSGIAVRKLSRLGNELYLTSSTIAAGIVPGHYDWGIVMILLLKRGAADWVSDGGFARPATLTQFSSINAMAASLNKPYATMHRYVTGLVKHGLVVRTDRGVAITNDPVIAPRIVAVMTLAHDSFVRLAEDLAGDRRFPAPTRAVARDLSHRILLAALDVWLVPHEYAREPVVDWTSKLVWIVIVVANVRHIVTDPVLSDRYADDPTPDDLRRPITVRAIARLSGLSYGTVYRHCRTLAALDVIRYDRDGWLLVSRQLANEEVDQGVTALLDYFDKRIVELGAYGFDPAGAGAFYLDGRPPYVPITP